MSGSWTNVGSGTASTVVAVPGLSPGTEYDLDVIASNAEGAATSAILTVTTLAGAAPSQVTGLAASAASSTSLLLSWSAATGTPTISYQVQYRVTGQTAWTDFGSPGTVTSATITGLTAGSSYDVEVVATNSIGSSTSGTLTTSTQTAGTSPAAPTGLLIGTTGVTSIALSWTASATGSSSIFYQVQYRVTGQTLWINFGSAAASTSAVVAGLAAGSSYDLQVIASNGYGSAGSSVITASTTASAGIVPSAPTGISITALSPTSITLSWTASVTGSAPISYQVQYRAIGSLVWSSIVASSLSATVTGLIPGTTYSLQILASNPAGASFSTVSTVATPAASTPPGAPGAPVAWIIMANSVSLTWAASTSGTAPIAYQVQFRVDGTTAWTLSGTTSAATSTTVEGLTAGADYDFQVVAMNSTGVSYSPVLTILAPTVGGSVSEANYKPGQVLTAEELDASLDSKLDVAGGPVGPLQFTQAGGSGQVAMIELSRTSGAIGDVPMVSGSYIANMADGPVVPYGAVGMTVTVTGDANGNGPAGNVWTLYGSLTINALRSSSAPATGSKHAAVTGQVSRSTPATGIPAGRRMADGTGLYAPVADLSNLPSAQSGALLAAHGVMTLNGADNADLRYGARFVYGEAAPVASGGMPAEVARGLYIGPSSTTAYAKVILEVAGNYGVGALDLRSANAYQAVITSSTPAAPVTSLSVDRVAGFSSAGMPAMAVSSTNPLAIAINGHGYSVVGASFTAGTTSGVLTFASPVSIADATQGNLVVPTGSHTIWLSEANGNALAGDIAFNRAGTSRVYYQTGLGLVIASGADQLALQGTSAVLLPVGNTNQRPNAPQFGNLRANSDSGTYEVWQPTTSSWTSLGAGSQSGVSGTVPGPATSLLTGTPSVAAVPLSWIAPTSGTTPYAYQVQYRVTGTSGWVNWGGQQAATSTTVSGLTANARYDFQIITSNGYGSSTSAIASITTASIVPAAPTNVATGTATSTTMAVSWTASASGTTPISYLVNYRVTGQTPWSPSPFGPTTGTSQTISGLTAGSSYDVQIVATNAAGSTASTTATASTSAAATVAPSVPTGVAAGSPTSSSLAASWSAPASGSTPFSYQVYYRVTGQSAWIPFSWPVTGTSQTISGLAAATSYDVQVVATNSAGSGTSALSTAITSATTTPSSGSVSGTQTSGIAVPVITGPTAGAAVIANVLSLTGITIADQGAAVASGACKLTISCTSGTVSTTVAGAQVAGSGTNSLSYSNTLASCQVAAADLVYTAGTTAGADNVVVKLTDQSGANSSISIPVTVNAAAAGGSSGTIPTDATGTVAVSAQTVLNGFGVNTRIDEAGYQNLGLAAVENAINYLGGVKLLRDSATTTNDSTWFPQVSQASNAKYIAYIAQANQANFNFILNNAEMPAQYIAAFEGCDEADTGQSVGYAETLAQAATFQQTVWSAGQAYGCPVIQMSFGQGWSANPTQGNYGAVGNLAASATYGNVHLRPPSAPNDTGLLTTYVQQLATLATPGKAAAITEFGYIQEASSLTNSCTPGTASAYILTFLFDAFLLGCPYYLWQALIDNIAGGGGAATGLFDDTGAPRPSATAVRNLFGLLTDLGSTFTPGKLNFTLANFPTTSGTTGGKKLLMQQSSGIFWLALWNEQTLNNTSTGADISVSPVNITLTFGSSMTSVTVYDPSISAAIVQSASSVTSLSISLPPRVILVKIVHP